MPFLNIWDLMMVIGIAQGMIMGFLLWFRKDSTISAKFLAAIFLSLAWASFGTLLSEHEPAPITRTYIWMMRYVPFYLIMLTGPSLLFLIKSQTDRGFELNGKKKRHYWAVIFNLIPSLGWMVSWSAWKLDIYLFSNVAFAHFINGFYTYGDVIYWLHMLVYTLIARNYLRKNGLDNKKLHEIITAFQVFLAIWLPFLVIYVSPFSIILDPISYYPIFIPITILTYWLGFQWFFHLYRNKIPSKPIDIDSHKVAEILNEAINDGLYLNSELTVKAAAKKLGIPQRVLSQYINQYLHKSFNDYINGYRIKEVKRKLTDLRYEHLTIAAIAHDSGFKSIATFQRAFKHVEGKNPVEYKNQLKNNPQITI